MPHPGRGCGVLLLLKTWQGVVRDGGSSIFLLDPAFPPAAFVFVGLFNVEFEFS